MQWVSFATGNNGSVLTHWLKKKQLNQRMALLAVASIGTANQGWLSGEGHMRSWIVWIAILGLPPGIAVADEPETINGVAVSQYEQMLHNKGDRTNRLRALETLGRYARSPADYTQAFKAAAADPDELVRATTVRAIGEIGRRAPSLLPEFQSTLETNLQDTQFRVRAEAARAVSQFGSAGRPFLEEIRRLRTADSSAAVRQAALEALVAITAGSDDHRDAVLAAVIQREFLVHPDWVRDLVRFWRNSPEAIMALRRLVDYQWPDVHPSGTDVVRRQAILGLGMVGTPASSAIDDLLAVVDSPLRYQDVFAKAERSAGARRRVGREVNDLWIRLTAYWAIFQIDPGQTDNVVKRLADQLQSAEPDTRRCAAVIVSRLAYIDKMRSLLPPIQRLAQDEDLSIRSLARLAELRLRDDSTREMTPTRLGVVPLPDDTQRRPDAATMKAALLEKLERFQSPSLLGEAYPAVATMLSPSELERALLQGDLLQQLERKQTLQLVSTLFEDAEIRQFDPIAGTALISSPKPDSPQLPMLWFDGQWYIDD